jgi:hypothetical protein
LAAKEAKMKKIFLAILMLLFSLKFSSYAFARGGSGGGGGLAEARIKDLSQFAGGAGAGGGLIGRTHEISSQSVFLTKIQNGEYTFAMTNSASPTNYSLISLRREEFHQATSNTKELETALVKSAETKSWQQIEN